MSLRISWSLVDRQRTFWNQLLIDHEDELVFENSHFPNGSRTDRVQHRLFSVYLATVMVSVVPATLKSQHITVRI